MKEADVTKQIRDILTACGIFHWKVWQGMGSLKGVSDIIGCHNGQFFAIEVKRPGGKPSMYQEHFIERVKEAGGIAFVAWSAEDVVKALGLEVELWPLFHEDKP